MSESNSPDTKPQIPVFGILETGVAESVRKPNQEKPIELGLNVPRIVIENKDELTIPVKSTDINSEPDKKEKNPYIAFGTKTVTAHSHAYGYGAGSGEHITIEPNTPIRFLTPPTRNEGVWSWYVLVSGRTAHLWTDHRDRGTLITYEKDKPPLVNFIVEDIRN